jgi:hypothetical protein
MQNEDSIFFWNPLGELANPKGKWKEHGKLLRRRFAGWVKDKYKTDAALEFLSMTPPFSLTPPPGRG